MATNGQSHLATAVFAPVETGQRPPRGRSLLQRALWLRIPRIETYPIVVNFAESYLGRTLLFAAFGLCLSRVSSLWLPITLGAIACALAERRRPWVVTLATASVLCWNPFWFDAGLMSVLAAKEGAQDLDIVALGWGMLLLVFMFSAGAVYCTRRFRNLLIIRRPVLSLLSLFTILVLVASRAALHGVPKVLLWSFISTLGAYFWFLAYALLDQSAKERNRFLIQVGTFHPFWGASTTPIGKGATYLRKFEARTAHDLAVTQLKGIKLLIWAVLLRGCLFFFTTIAHGYLHIPTLNEAFARGAAGSPYPWYLCWGSLVSTFLEQVLWLSVWGHAAVATARMAGFRLLRNTYRPFQAKTIAEFWNRYYYYFKELLVDFFFYPTFVRCFRRNKRLRLFFATFMAAGVGNMIFHFMRDIRVVAELGLWEALVKFQTYGFYCLVLALAIAISQLRGGKSKEPAGWIRGTLLPSAWVGLFYCMLSVFDDEQGDLVGHFYFLIHLFEVST